MEYYNVLYCDPADNTDTAGYNAFCNSKSSSAPYCDPNLKKCEPCSIVNNDPATSGNPNVNDCGSNAQLIIGKCDLVSGASLGGICRFDAGCVQNSECTSACCSAVPPVSGPGKTNPPDLIGNRCISPASADNPINPYLCKNA